MDEEQPNTEHLACVPTKIIKGLQVSGIFPFNRRVFDSSEFAPSGSLITDQPDPCTIDASEAQSLVDDTHPVNNHAQASAPSHPDQFHHPDVTNSDISQMHDTNDISSIDGK